MGSGSIRVSLPWHAVPRVAPEQQHADAAVPADAALFWFSPAAIAAAVHVYAEGYWSSPGNVSFALPPGMLALIRLQVQDGTLRGD